MAGLLSVRQSGLVAQQSNQCSLPLVKCVRRFLYHQEAFIFVRMRIRPGLPPGPLLALCHDLGILTNRRRCGPVCAPSAVRVQMQRLIIDAEIGPSKSLPDSTCA